MNLLVQSCKTWWQHSTLFYSQKENAHRLGKMIAAFAAVYLCLCVTVTNAGMVEWFLEDVMGLDPAALIALAETEANYIAEGDAEESENRFQLQFPSVVSEYVLNDEYYNMTDDISTALDDEFMSANEMEVLWDEETLQEFSNGVLEFVGEKRPPQIKYD